MVLGLGASLTTSDLGGIRKVHIYLLGDGGWGESEKILLFHDV